MKKITMQNAKNTTITVEEAYEFFLRKCKIKNLSERSIISYEQKLKSFFDFLKSTKIYVSTITKTTVEDYVFYLQEKGSCNDITINSYLRNVRAFLYYCMECGYMDKFTVHLMKTEKKVKETYTDEELQRILTKPNVRTCTFTQYKTWVIINYLLATGNRISTALNLHIEDLNFDEMQITLRKTKNRKQQIIPMSKSLAEVLTEYLTFRNGAPKDFLFCNIYGNKASINTIQKEVKEHNITHNVNKTSCHLFRHTFAKHWIVGGGDIFRLSKILGHSTLDMTKEYLNFFSGDLAMDFERFNPLDKFAQNGNRIRI